jgi:geranylgeranyl pyrophosphate synthase
MKKTTRKHERNKEQLLEKTREMLEKEGAKGWALAKETLLQQRTHSPQLKQALNYAAEIPDYFRPAIVSLCSKAVGGDPEATIPSGASFIMLAKAIGIHDDIIDNLKIRNKRPTLFGEFGKEIALIISDILMFKAFTLMRKNAEAGVSRQTTVKILEAIDKFWFEQGESEILELQSRAQINITPQECMAKIKMRASELETITRVGGILGKGSEREIEALGRYGRLLGIASILRDELVDMLELGALRNRIKHESLPLPLVYALQNTKLKSKIARIASEREVPNKTLLKISKTTDDLKGMDYVAADIEKAVYEAHSYIKNFESKSSELQLLATSLLLHPVEWKSVLRSM